MDWLFRNRFRQYIQLNFEVIQYRFNWGLHTTAEPWFKEGWNENILADIFLTLLSLFSVDELWLRGYQEFDPSRGERAGKSFLSPPPKKASLAWVGKSV